MANEPETRLVADLGEKNLMMLWNHGTLAVGSTAAQCWVGIYNLERACQIQVLASAQGREHIRMAPDAAIETVRQQVTAAIGVGAALAWPGCLRKVERESPGYDT
jgi:ribulose-5-phosphate 4-epimerase/fuculose-1-phosphate aldolase